jgi:hypothetical protein
MPVETKIPVKADAVAPGEIATLLRGNVEAIHAWNTRWDADRFALHLAVIVLGAGCYGAAMGWWRDPQQAVFTAIKFPLIILLTALGNALINGMLAPLLGLNIPFRQSFSAIVMSFAAAAAIFGAFSPLIAFMVWNAPPLVPGKSAALAYNSLLLAQVLVVSLAGTTGNLRLFQLLAKAGGSRAVALRVMFAWLAGNFFLGSQLSWILRPFIGSPDLPVQFLRPTAFEGNFYEAVFRSLQNIFHIH